MEFDSGVSRDARPKKTIEPPSEPIRFCDSVRVSVCVSRGARPKNKQSDSLPREFDSRFSRGASHKYVRKLHSDKAPESSRNELWFSSRQDASRTHLERYRPEFDSVLRKSGRSHKACRSQLEVVTASLVSVLPTSHACPTRLGQLLCYSCPPRSCVHVCVLTVHDCIASLLAKGPRGTKWCHSGV